MKKQLASAFAALLTATALAPGWAQAAAPPVVLKPLPQTDPAQATDVSTIPAIVLAFDTAISAGVGQTLDRARLRGLFIPDGRIVISVPPRTGHAANVLIVTPDGYADAFYSEPAKEGFFDSVLFNRIEQFGDMAHVYSGYASRRAKSDPTPMARGIKSLELLNSGGRWYIVSVYYDYERPGVQLPASWLTENAVSSTAKKP